MNSLVTLSAIPIHLCEIGAPDNNKKSDKENKNSDPLRFKQLTFTIFHSIHLDLRSLVRRRGSYHAVCREPIIRKRNRTDLGERNLLVLSALRPNLDLKKYAPIHRHFADQQWCYQCRGDPHGSRFRSLRRRGVRQGPPPD